jgi:hypothetical protein
LRSPISRAPTVDGQTIPKPPTEAIRAGVAANIDLLVGSNTEETRLPGDLFFGTLFEERLYSSVGAVTELKIRRTMRPVTTWC